jgi:hypothetical protein
MGRPRNPPKLEAVLADPFLFISRLSVVDKKGKLCKLIPNGEQIKIITALHSGDDTLILKSRQIGSTTAVAAYFFWKWYVSTSPTTHVILSHKMTSSQHIFKMFKRFWDSLPETLRRPLALNTNHTMVLQDTGATLQAHTAGGDGGLRSFSASSIHLSEYAFTDDAEELKATAVAALNGGQLCIESTANHWGDPLHNEIQLWEANMVEWRFLFFPWTEHEGYSIEPPWDWEPDPDSQLSKGQQYWMAKQVGKLGWTKFRREYPLNVEDAYAQTDGAWIPGSIWEDFNIIKGEPDGIVFSKIDHNDKYAIGVDVGAGTGGDYSALVVMSALTGDIVEIRRANDLTPTEWADVVADASRKWKEAKVLVESNGTWGGVVITELRHMRIPLWKTGEGKDWITNASNKPIMLESIKDRLLKGQLRNIDHWTMGELRSFKVNDRGEPFCPRNGVHHGDTVMALACSIQCLESISPPTQAYLPDWLKLRRLQRSQNSGNMEELRRYK